jgi:hypothetical protein
MATFGLVHGAGHAAWCWERLIPILEGLGHRAFAMDLPCEDPTAGPERYAEVVDRALLPASDLVLVGHSLAGLTVPLVAARRPVRRLVFLCALVPEFKRSLADQVAADLALLPGLHPEDVNGYFRTCGRGSGPGATVPRRPGPRASHLPGVPGHLTGLVAPRRARALASSRSTDGSPRPSSPGPRSSPVLDRLAR